MRFSYASSILLKLAREGEAESTFDVVNCRPDSARARRLSSCDTPGRYSDLHPDLFCCVTFSAKQEGNWDLQLYLFKTKEEAVIVGILGVAFSYANSL